MGFAAYLQTAYDDCGDGDQSCVRLRLGRPARLCDLLGGLIGLFCRGGSEARAGVLV
jgi:hypothetical protein